MKIKKVVAIVIVIFVFCLTVTVFALTSSDKRDHDSVIEMLFKKYPKEYILSDLKDKIFKDENVVVATINGDPIYKHQVEFDKYFNKFKQEYIKLQNAENAEELLKLYPTDEIDVIKRIAKNRLLIEEAKSVGIVVTDADIAKRHENYEKNLDERIKSGDEDAIKQKNEEEHFYRSLGMTKEKYRETIDKDIKLYYLTYEDYVVYYYSKFAEGEEIVPIEEYLDNLLKEAALKIYK